MFNGEELKENLKKIHLLYVTDKRPGIMRQSLFPSEMRQKISKKFMYYDSEGKEITDSKTLSRIKKLVIPPAWENVWICDSAKGHLQATGYDEKGRKQYIYHPDWIKLCQENKFNKMIFLGKVLPKIRKQVSQDMSLPGMQRKKIIATIVWLLEHTFIRVGNDEYAKANDSYGLTTLRNKHAEVKGNRVCLEFVGKSGVRHSIDIYHPQVAKIIKKCIELPGYELFQYLDDEGQKHTIDSQDVNEYLKEITGQEITAKDFRTWGATLISAVSLNKMGECSDKKSFKKNVSQVIKIVSTHLRNTPAICRNYYIHPTIFKTYQQNLLCSNFGKKNSKVDGLTSEEQLVVNLLKKYPAA